MLKARQSAPDFELPDQAGRPFRLFEHRGETIALYFYPRADTPGCTTQACGVRDRKADYEAAGARVIGISPDPVEAVSRFAKVSPQTHDEVVLAALAELAAA